MSAFTTIRRRNEQQKLYAKLGSQDRVRETRAIVGNLSSDERWLGGLDGV